MALYRALSPALVLCAPCREKHDYSDRVSSLVADEDMGSVLVRDVCVAIDCPELQLRGHLCADHMLDFELAWQHQIPVRACHGCNQSTLQLSRDRQDVWFMLTPSDVVREMRGTEHRLIDKSRLETSRQIKFQSPMRAKAKGRGLLRTSLVKKRRSARTLRQICDRERLLAMEWSLGNIQVKQLFLWKDNKRRLDAETSSSTSEPVLSNALEKKPSEQGGSSAVPTRPEPTAALCVEAKCRFFAKTGDRCQYHASMLARRLLQQRVSAASLPIPAPSPSS